MAAPTKFSFSVRSILDLPERDVEAAPRSSPLFSCSSSSPFTAWMECDRSPCICEYKMHYYYYYYIIYLFPMAVVKKCNLIMILITYIIEIRIEKFIDR